MSEMADRHKYRPISFRPPEDDRLWLEEHAAATGAPVRKLLALALAEYRQRREAPSSPRTSGSESTGP